MTRQLAAPSVTREAVDVSHAGRWLIVRFAEEHDVASWALVGGGLGRAGSVVWHQVSEEELRPPIDARELFRARLRERALEHSVGLLTSRDLGAYVDVVESQAGVEARCVATVGLGNALRAGDPPGPAGRIRRLGTINLLCRFSEPLSCEALLEAMAIATEARTLAVRDGAVLSTVTGKPASGTGTDCVVVAAPAHGAQLRYAGKHTLAGHLIGAAAYQASRRGVEDWKREWEARQQSRELG
jgi:adenosylcobinamide amidohydrolase